MKTLAKLLKEKNLLVSRISEKKTRIIKENILEGNNTSKYDLKAEYQELLQLTNDLIATKTKIAELNRSVVDKIYRLSELKSLITFLRRLETKEGTYKKVTGWGKEELTETFTAQLDSLFVDEQLKTLTAEVSKLQDELDEYNYTVKTAD